MDVKVKRVLEHWILGLIDYPRFARSLIDGLKDDTESKVKSTITVDGKVYELNIILKEKPSDITITVDVDTEPALNKINELKN